MKREQRQQRHDTCGNNSTVQYNNTCEFLVQQYNSTTPVVIVQQYNTTPMVMKYNTNTCGNSSTIQQTVIVQQYNKHRCNGSRVQFNIHGNISTKQYT